MDSVQRAVHSPEEKDGVRERSDRQVRVGVLIHVQVSGQRVAKQSHSKSLAGQNLKQKKHTFLVQSLTVEYVFIKMCAEHQNKTNCHNFSVSDNLAKVALCWTVSTHFTSIHFLEALRTRVWRLFRFLDQKHSTFGLNVYRFSPNAYCRKN